MTGNYHILYWRNIPSMVKGKVGRTRLSCPLTPRFMEAIDAAAMRAGDTDSDQYLEDWNASDPIPIEGDGQQCIDKAAADIEQQYPRERLVELIKNGGRDT